MERSIHQTVNAVNSSRTLTRWKTLTVKKVTQIAQLAVLALTVSVMGSAASANDQIPGAPQKQPMVIVGGNDPSDFGASAGGGRVAVRRWQDHCHWRECDASRWDRGD